MDAQHGTTMMPNILDLAPMLGYTIYLRSRRAFWGIDPFIADAQADLNQVLDNIQLLSQWRQCPDDVRWSRHNAHALSTV